MMNLGIYYPGESFWHLADPRSKLMVTLVLIIALLVFSGWLLAGLALIVVILYLTAQIPLNLSAKLLWKFKWLILISLIANIMVNLNTYGNDLIGLIPALESAIRLSLMLVMAVWLSYVTKPMALMEGLTRLLQPLAKLNVPIDSLSLIMSLVLRFIPEMIAESENIAMAQQLRGLSRNDSWKNGKLWIKSTIIPLFIISIRRSVAIATAMEARGYRPGCGLTSMEELFFRTKDYLILISSGLFLILIFYFIR